jgi:hypothetical protein
MGRTYTANNGNNYNIALNLLNIHGYREKWCKVLAARRIFSKNTQNILLLIGIDVTRSLGLVVTPDQLVLMDLSSNPALIKFVLFLSIFLFYYLSQKFFIFFNLKI